MSPPSDDGFISGDCPGFDGDDVANIYVFESHEGMIDYFNLDQPGPGPDGAAGDNWLVSVRWSTTAEKVARAAEGRVVGYGS